MNRMAFDSRPLGGLAIVIASALVGCGSEAASGPAAADPTLPPTAATSPSVTPAASGAAGAAALPPTTASAPVATTATQPPTTTPATTPAAPASAQPPAAATTPATTTGAMDVPAGGHMLAMDECGLHTQYAGDEYCILPPPTDKGFQLHIGPSNYDKPEATYILQPGEENVINLTATSGNDKDVLYYYRQYRMRPGSHHVILTANGKSIGGTQNLARDNPDFGIIPPENEDVGLPLDAHSNINANMHFYNFSEKPMIRELWVNYWYKDPADVKETANRIFSPTSVSAAVAHSHVIVGASCPVNGTGRVLTLAGHRHLNNVRFSVWHTSAGKKDLVFDDYDSQNPGDLEYNSITMNPMVDPMHKMLGGTTGILNVKTGDTLDFECEIVNNTDKNFYGANEAQDDEMCILTGDAVGATISAGCQTTPARKVQ